MSALFNPPNGGSMGVASGSWIGFWNFPDTTSANVVTGAPGGNCNNTWGTLVPFVSSGDVGADTAATRSRYASASGVSALSTVSFGGRIKTGPTANNTREPYLGISATSGVAGGTGYVLFNSFSNQLQTGFGNYTFSNTILTEDGAWHDYAFIIDRRVSTNKCDVYRDGTWVERLAMSATTGTVDASATHVYHSGVSGHYANLWSYAGIIGENAIARIAAGSVPTSSGGW